MGTFFLDPEAGNNGNDGTTYANRWADMTNGATAARIAPGDTIRVKASPDPTSLGISATWTNKSPVVTLASALNALVNDGETAWTASANVTATKSTTVYRTGTGSSSLAIASGFTTGKVAYFDLGSNQDYSGYQGVTFWFRVNGATLGAGVLTLDFCSDAAGATPVDTFAIPAIGQADQWVAVYVDKGSALGSAIRSISVNAISDPGTITLFLDNISTVKAAGSDALNLQSLIGKNAAGETWWCLREINGTTLRIDAHPAIAVASLGAIRGYSGTTETVTTYKRETVKLPLVTVNASNNTVQDSGTAGNLITFSGGWDRTDMSSQTGETWWDQQSGNGYVIAGVSKSYIKFTKMSCVRGNYGLRMEAGCTGMEVPDGHFNHNQNIGFYQGGSSMILGDIFSCSNGATGMGDNIGSTFSRGTITGTLRCLSNMTNGLQMQAFQRALIEAIVASNNGTAGITSTTSGVAANANVEAYLKAVTANDNGSYGVVIDNGFSMRGMRFGSITATGNGSRGVALGASAETTLIESLTTSGNTTAGVEVIFTSGGGNIIVRKSSISESTKIMETTVGGASGQTGSVRFQNYLGTVGSFLSYIDGSKAKVTGVMDADRHTASGTAWKVSPLGSSYTSADFPVRLPIKSFAVNASALVTVRAWVKRDNTGLTAKLVCPGGQIAGVASDVADTLAAPAGVYEELEITFTPSEKGVVTIELQCYGGSTYSAWVDDLTAIQA